MDLDNNEGQKVSNNPSNRLYKTAINGILLNNNKYDSKLKDSYKLNESKTRKLGLISRLIGKQLNDRSSDLNGPKSSRWNHDKFHSLVSYKPGSMIFVRNLPNDVTYDDIKSLFGDVGNVSSIKIDKGSLTCAFIGFAEKNSAQKAVETFHKVDFKGRTIKVSISESERNRNKKTTSQTGRVSIFDRMG